MSLPKSLLARLLPAFAVGVLLAGGAARAEPARIDGWQRIHFGMTKQQVLAELPGSQVHDNLCGTDLMRHGWDCEWVGGFADVAGARFGISVYFTEDRGEAVRIRLNADGKDATPQLYERLLASLPLAQGKVTTRKRRDENEALLGPGRSCAEIAAAREAGQRVRDREWLRKTYLGDALTLDLDGPAITAEYSKNGLCAQTPAAVRLAWETAHGDFVNHVILEVDYLAPGQSVPD